MFILPYYKDNPVRRTPWILCAIILVNAVVLIWTYVGHSPNDLFLNYGFVPAQHRPVTLLTSMFLHSGFWHFAGNMFFLWMFANRVENMLGKALFLLSYLACGVGGAWLHFEFDPTSTIPCVGASGAISGVAGMFFVLFPRAKFDLDIYLGWWRIGTVPTRTYGAVGAWIGEQTILGIITQMTHASSIAFWAHVGGFLTGLLLGAVFVLWVPESARRTRGTEYWHIEE